MNNYTQIDFNVSWYSDTKRSKNVRKSSGSSSIKNSCRSITKKTILDLNVVFKAFEKGKQWLEEIRISELGKLYQEYPDLRTRLTN